ncbi:tail fiber protein [Aureisphaera galaxeae]|uniref:tail fiber protein n=1 Tax=Aureisphaera galaxeae TaxID=1538023 RepID=UPI00234FD649|nr:tail fiber protein [Aureisphaera galaxeae]MDC8004469.1 tail fiber protein [Aureisphaera galaxeae]
MKNLLLIALAIGVTSCTAQRMAFSNLTEKNGKIGIGTSNPDELLTVKGKIHTQEVIVDLKGAVAPDYVFESYYENASLRNPDYRLLSLTDLEKFIEENHHLPKVPSADEIETEGLALKEMNLLLLEKVEELTLYTLQQQKEIDALKKKIEEISQSQR